MIKCSDYGLSGLLTLNLTFGFYVSHHKQNIKGFTVNLEMFASSKFHEIGPTWLIHEFINL